MLRVWLINQVMIIRYLLGAPDDQLEAFYRGRANHRGTKAARRDGPAL